MVYKSSTVTFIKKGKNWDLTVNWEGNRRKFWVNFPFPLLKIVAQKRVGDTKKCFTIKAENVQLLTTFIKKHKNKVTYNDALNMFYDLGNQFQTLERFFLGIPFVSLSDIVVVNSNNNLHFFYLNDEKTHKISSGQLMLIDSPYKKSPFISPEMNQINKLPMKLNFKSGLYSLGAMVTFCLFNKYVTLENKDEILAPIYTSSLYWGLIRILVDNPDNRFYIII